MAAAAKDVAFFAAITCLLLVPASYGRREVAGGCVSRVVNVSSTLIVAHNGSQCHLFRVYFSSDSDVVGVSFQVHTQSRKVTLTTSLSPPYDNTTNGTHVGLVQFRRGEQQWAEFYAMFERGPTNGTARALVAAMPIRMYDPVAGACATTSNLLYDAQLTLTHTDLSTTFTFFAGDLGYGTRGLPTCDNPSPAPIQELVYYGYLYFLPERSYSEDAMFEGIRRMLTAESVLKNGQLVEGLQLSYKTPKRVVLDSMREQGVVYNMMAFGGGRYGAYIPVATYGCDYSEEEGGCVNTGSIITMVTGAIIGVVGLYVCFIGHRFFHVEVPILTSVIWSFVVFCILEAHSGWSELAIQLSSIALSAVPTIIITFLWLMIGNHFFLVFAFAAFASFNFTLVLLYTPLGFLSCFEIPYVYGLTVFCGTVVFLVPLMMLELVPICIKKCKKEAMTRITNIIVCAFLGSTGVIFGISSFLLTSLRLIWTNFLNRVTIPGFDFNMYRAIPFQLDEILLCLAWLVLLLLGVVLQSVLSCRRPPFPTKSLYRRCREKTTEGERADRGLNGFAASARETSPLLGYGRSSRKYRRVK